jgi:hypothetical protein
MDHHTGIIGKVREVKAVSSDDRQWLRLGQIAG